MKTISLLVLSLIISLFLSCEKGIEEQNYIFTSPHCATVTVGGVVGLAERCFKVGDRVKGKPAQDGTILIRIAARSSRNDGPPSSSSYQEFLNVPSVKLKLSGE